MDEREFEDAVQQHNTPPPTPRDRMWQRIDAARAERRGVVQPDFTARRSPAVRWGRLTAAAAAVLLVGFAVGRWTSPEPPPTAGDTPPSVAVSAPKPGPDAKAIQAAVFKRATNKLFDRADLLLTDFKVRTCTTDDLAEVPGWARGLLVQTRLLLDSPAADDVEMRKMLQDLELGLAQISGLSRSDCTADMASIRAGLDRRDTIDRMRLMSATGSVPGAL